MRAYVGGVNGSGKSTILAEVTRQKPEFTIIHSVTAFTEWLGFPGDYEKLRAIPPEEGIQKLSQFMDVLLAKPIDILLFDSHYLNLVRGVIKPVMGPWIKKFDVLILISADIDSILKRIESDSRDRALFPPEATKETCEAIYKNYCKQYKDVFHQLALQYNLPSKEIENSEGEISQVAQELIDIVNHRVG